MGFAKFAKAAADFGDVPAAALFLIFAIYLQNRRLAALLQRKDGQMGPMPGRKGYPDAQRTATRFW